MSADRWSICPRCLKVAQEAHNATVARAEAMYGKVSMKDFEETRKAAAHAVEREDYRTFREDYEFYGAETGEVTADYSGECQVCSLEMSFQAKEKIIF